MKKVWIGIAVLALLSVSVVALAQVDDRTTNYGERSDFFSWTAYWDTDHWVYPGGSSPEKPLNITCDVEMYVSQTGYSTVYFHIGQDASAGITVNLPGTLGGNHPSWVGICNEKWVEADGDPDGDATVLKYKDGSNPYLKTGEIIDNIPVKFEFDDGTGPVDAQWSGGTGNWGWWSPSWLPRLVPVTDYKFIVTITPDGHQGHGLYELDPVWVVAPAM